MFKPFFKIQRNLALMMCRRLILLALFIIFNTITHAQYVRWMMGTWKSTSGSTATRSVTKTIQITDVSGESFTGTKTIEINDRAHAKITISISGSFRGRGLFLQNGEVLHKEAPEVGEWYDCSSCIPNNKMIIGHDSLILISSISDCDKRCDGDTYYYRLLSEYDSSTQRYLVDRFGNPSDIIGFQPNRPKKDETVTSNDSTAEILKKEKRQQDSLDNVARIRQQQMDDSIRIAQQKKRQQEITDSLNLVRQKERQRIKDSLENVARLEQIKRRTEDSLRNVQIKKRQQEVADSLNLVNQRKQQRVKDSLQAVAAANLQKQRTADSLRDVQVRKRQQQIADSLAAARKQRYDDSLQKAALTKAVPPPVTDSNKSAADKALTTRTSVLLKTYHITTPDILIELFDNGEIDGDRVSVYHNNEMIVSNQVLGLKPITLNIHADTTNREHEFVLVADNLGSIPPNSALMRVTVGKQSYKLTVNTDMKTNARIVFFYDGN